MAQKKARKIGPEFLYKALSKCFSLREQSADFNPLSEAQEEYHKLLESHPLKIGFMDRSCIMMIQFKTSNFENWFMTNFDVKPVKMVEVTNSNLGSGRYSIEYLKLATEICSADDDAIKITSRNDAPISMETTNLIIVFAPRIENDE
jgi:hypothetical protein